jgi:hypothetical protein
MDGKLATLLYAATLHLLPPLQILLGHEDTCSQFLDDTLLEQSGNGPSPFTAVQPVMPTTSIPSVQGVARVLTPAVTPNQSGLPKALDPQQMAQADKLSGTPSANVLVVNDDPTCDDHSQTERSSAPVYVREDPADSNSPASARILRSLISDPQQQLWQNVTTSRFANIPVPGLPKQAPLEQGKRSCTMATCPLQAAMAFTQVSRVGALHALQSLGKAVRTHQQWKHSVHLRDS